MGITKRFDSWFRNYSKVGEVFGQTEKGQYEFIREIAWRAYRLGKKDEKVKAAEK